MAAVTEVIYRSLLNLCSDDIKTFILAHKDFAKSTGMSAWRAVTDASGKTYYYNTNTKQSTWELPTGESVQDEKNNFVL